MNTDDVANWWSTAIIEMEPGRIALRGHPIESLIGEVGFVDMIWLMVQGTLPNPAQRTVLEAALVAAVDHGPQAPSIAAARMSITCGIGLNNAMATGINLLGDIHGGAGQQALLLYRTIAERIDSQGLLKATQSGLAEYRSVHGPYIPGFGHRFHKPEDPRAKPLMKILRAQAEDPQIHAIYADIAETIQAELSHGRAIGIAMNIDGATAALYGALGVSPELSRGLFCLSRSVGILAHAWEQKQQGGRNKGPTPPHYRWTYTGKTS